MAAPVSISAPVIKVLVVDDSAIVRQVLTRQLQRDPQICVVGTAPDPYVARDKIEALKPDVLTLDIEMPRMDGITFLNKLMAYHPMPVIVISSLTARGTATAIQAMEAGAVEVLAKPGSAYSVGELATVLIQKVKLAACSRISSLAPAKPGATQLSLTETTDQVFAIGTSTGGVQALSQILPSFPKSSPGILVVQHMPPGFTASFAARLDSICAMNVKEAADGDVVVNGRILIAPGGKHMQLVRRAARYYVELNEAPPVHHQRPSVELLFQSVAHYAGANAIGAILTGMGADGAQGLLAMRKSGARTLAQDQQSCTVFGMPHEAIKCGAAEFVVPLAEVAPTMIHLLQQKQTLSVS
ncbi:MAG: chemotaxis response regulator protein-glutamate methylesterase [Phycisphaerales bacterium]|nr:chemotaxis response regulator protein-glutamate methylesterase [Phycisphaerales bacterium]